MSDLNTLSQMLLELDDNLVSCMHCGMCQAVCPVYGATMREADVTRGKIVLLENLARKMIDDPAGVNDKLNRCLLCGSCESNCPSGVKIMDIFLRARSIVAGYMGLSPVKKAIFRGMLKRPALFNALLDIGSKFQGLFLKDASQVVGTSCSALFAPIIGDRHFPKLAKEPFHSKVKSLDSAPGKSGLKVAFFPGCVSDKMFPGIAEASLKIFEHHGVGVFMPDKQVCCGIPALASGDRKAYEDLLAMNLSVFGEAEFDYFITPCATCTATIKEIWPKLTDNLTPWQKEKIARLHEKAMDITAFVVDVLGVAPASMPKGGEILTYHDSCHMKKSLGVSAQPRKLLGMNSKYQLKEMAESDRCCGSGGSFTLYHYDISKEIGQRKRNNIVATGASYVATGCPACMMQMMDMLSHNNDFVNVKHVVEIYAETLK